MSTDVPASSTGGDPEWLQRAARKLSQVAAERAKESQQKRQCRFCSSVGLRAMIDNGVYGTGYRVKE